MDFYGHGKVLRRTLLQYRISCWNNLDFTGLESSGELVQVPDSTGQSGSIKSNKVFYFSGGLAELVEQI